MNLNCRSCHTSIPRKRRSNHNNKKRDKDISQNHVVVIWETERWQEQHLGEKEGSQCAPCVKLGFKEGRKGRLIKLPQRKKKTA